MADIQYALVHEGKILTDKKGELVMTGYLPEKPDDHSTFYPADARWLPVETVDSQPFHMGRHARSEPEYRVGQDSVVRFYEVREIRR